MRTMIELLAHYITTRERDGLPPNTTWNLATGTAGLALLYEALAPVLSEDWHAQAEQALARTLALFVADPHASTEGGLFTGLAGVCQVVTFFAASRPEYRALKQQLDAQLYTVIHRRSALFPAGEVCRSFREYDVISGSAGIATYVLSTWLASPSPQAEAALDLLLARLLFLCQPDPQVPGHLRLFLAPACAPYRAYAQRFPQGATDCGFAHGVPGVLAALSLCSLRYAPASPALRCAVQTLACWLVERRQETRDRVHWPLVVPRDAPPVLGTHFWCYGSAGTAWALWLAGLALREHAYQTLALRTMKTLSDELLEQPGTLPPILCHGLAGILQVVHGFALATDEAFLRSFQQVLMQRLQAQFDASLPSGFWAGQASNEPLVRPCLLDGVAGLACALLPLEAQRRVLWPFFLCTQQITSGSSVVPISCAKERV